MQKLGVLYLWLIVIVAVSCTEEITVQLTDDNSGIEWQNSYAEAFKVIQYAEGYQIQIIDPSTKELVKNYFLGKEGVLHSVELVPEKRNRIIPLSATHIGMMEQLKVEHHIVGVSNKQYLCSDFLINQVNKGKVASIGDIGQGDVEAYVSAQPDLIIFSGFDMNAPILKKLKSAGLSTFTNFDWKETHPLGRAEWIKVMGLLFNKVDEAQKLFDDICRDYDVLKDQVAHVETKPGVLAGTMYGDIFNAPAGDSYMAQLLKDAGTSYVYNESKGVGSLSLSLEEVITMNKLTDYWINAAAQTKKDVLKMNERFQLLNAVKQDKVYSYYADVNCFWERAAITPHLILRDLCKIFHPDLINDEFVFYSKLN